MHGMRIRIRRPERNEEELLVESDQLWIGSGSHCEIRLAPEEADFEHVRVRAVPAGLYAEARSVSPPPMLNGVEFTEAPILPGSVLGLGAVKLAIEPVGLEVPAEAEAKAERRSNPRLYLYAFVGIAGSAAIWLAKPKPRASLAEPEHVPALWGPAVGSCPQTAPEQARAVAESKLAAANGKRERSPFHAQDGVAAVPLYELAASCFRAAGDEASAREAAGFAAELQDRVSEDFRAERMRLARALATQDWPTARRALRTLLAYTEGTKNEYVDWLSNTERRIALVHGGKKK